MDIFKQLREAVSGSKIMEPVQRLNEIASTIDSLRGLLKDSKVSQSVKDMIQGLMTLITTRPNIAGINHYFNHFLLKLDPDNQPPVLKEMLEVYHERWKHIERRTAQVAFDLLRIEDETVILLHGSEKSVAALFDILKVQPAKVKVYQTLSRPGMSGRAQAASLAADGFDVTLIDDHTIGQILPDVDMVLTGCEVILHDDFMHIAGTHTLLAAAHFYKRPVFVLADSRRIMNTRYFPQNVLNSILGEGRSLPGELWKEPAEGVKIVNAEKEQAPNYLIERFILEDGAYPPDEIKSQIDKVMVTKFF